MAKKKKTTPVIYCITTRESFNSVADVVKTYPNINICDISQVARGVSNQAGGFKFTLKK